MRRSQVLVVAALILLVASTASAQWYVGMRLAGYYTEPDIEGALYRNYVFTDADGLFDYGEAIIGYGFEAFDAELSVGYNSYSATYEWSDGERQYDYDNSLNIYTFGMTGLYHICPADPVSLDGGLRVQLLATNFESIEDMSRQESTYTDETGGWAIGPVLRARWFFGDGALAVGPELYFKYTSMTHTEEYDYDRNGDETDLSSFGTEFSVRMDWFF